MSLRKSRNAPFLRPLCVSDAQRNKAVNFRFFKHERDGQIVESVAFQKRPEFLVDQFEYSLSWVVLNLDVNHRVLLETARCPADAGSASGGRIIRIGQRSLQKAARHASPCR